MVNTVLHERVFQEARHRQNIETGEDMIYRLSPSGYFTFVNPAAARTVKRTAEDCIGLHFLSLVRDDFRKTVGDFYLNQVRDRIFTTYLEFPVITGAAEEIWIGQNVRLVFDGGHLVELQAVGRDITGRRELERQLQDSEQRYRLLFESNPQPRWVFDEETMAFLAVNDAAITQYGYSREEFLRMTISDIRLPSDMAALRERKATVRSGFGFYDCNNVWRHRRKDGSLIDVEITWHTLTFAGRPAKLVLANDVTERRLAEAEILLQKRRFEQLFENAPLGILWVDENDRIVDANKEFGIIFDFALDDIRGRHINDVVVPPQFANEAVELSARTLRGESIEIETVRLRQDGSLVPVHLYGVPILGSESVIGVFAIYIDLTSRKEVEEARAKLTQEIEDQRSRLNNLLESIPCIVWESKVDPDTRLPIASFVIDIGRLSPAFPVTPPYMRVRIRRFRDLSQKAEVRSTFTQ